MLRRPEMDVIEQLLTVARAAQARAYAPYSNFPVGVALRTEGGTIHAGCNVENAAFPSGTCAEAGAIAAMVIAGETRITDLLVVGARQPISPCGACRQRIHEFATAATKIHCAGPDGVVATYAAADLLPHAFDPRSVLGAADKNEV